MFSKLWTIKLSDWQRALIVAILTAPAGILYDWATEAVFVLDWRSLVKGAVAGGVGYLLKNFLTGQGGKLLTNKVDAPAATKEVVK